MESFSIGTGATIYTQKIVPAILSADHEIILVTCYWASSKTLTAVCNALEQLARRRESRQPTNTLRLRICFSSRSLFQKLFHTSSTDGYVYPPSSWQPKLGLPSPDILVAGKIDLTVKSLFFLPFSVMHPKFLIVDRRHAFVPSCNVSWEPWLEACLELTRRSPRSDPIDGLLEFYRATWEKNLNRDSFSPQSTEMHTLADGTQPHIKHIITSPADASVNLTNIGVPSSDVEWLPSWHHRNPKFCFFPWQTPKAPDTPLNSALLKFFKEASRDVFIHTPNITSHPVLTAMVETLARGVNITIVTSKKMMVWEQVLTAGTTSERCIKNLAKRYNRLCESVGKSRQSQPDGDDAMDVEAQIPKPGSLKISYFRPAVGSSAQEEPVQSHVKLTIFDGERVVLGSGNMDRASWFTSQELGISVRNTAFAAAVKSTVHHSLEGRLEPVYPAKP